MTLAILSALPEEQQGIAELLDDARTHQHAGRRFVSGRWHGQSVVLALSGIGKVAAATTTAVLIERFAVQQLVFTGVAGGVGEGVAVGDVVVAQQLLQHDVDVRPLFARWLVPGYAQPNWICDARLSQALLQAAQATTEAAQSWEVPLLQGRMPQAHAGLIVSGDQFIVSANTAQAMAQDLQQAGYMPLAVEMECAAVAQVCADYGVPLAAVRTISDRADEQAHIDFPAFIRTVASRYALHMLEKWVRGLP